MRDRREELQHFVNRGVLTWTWVDTVTLLVALAVLLKLGMR